MRNGYQLYNEQNAPEGAGELLTAAKAVYGFIPNAVGALAESPQALQAYLTLGDLAEKSSLDPEQRMLLMLVASVENECNYCVPAVSTFARAGGIDPDLIDSIRDDRPLQNKKLEVMRQFAAKVVRNRGWITDTDVKAFLGAGYSRRQSMEVVMIVLWKSIAMYVNRMADPLLDEAFQDENWSKVA